MIESKIGGGTLHCSASADLREAYRSRPGGSAEGGVVGVAGSVPEFAATFDGAGCGNPSPAFISRCSLEQRGQ